MRASQFGLVLLVAIVSGVLGGAVGSWLLPARVLHATRFEGVDKHGTIRVTLDKSGLVFFPQKGNAGDPPSVALDADGGRLRLFGANIGDRVELSATEQLLRLSDAQGKILWEVPKKTQAAVPDEPAAAPPAPGASPLSQADRQLSPGSECSSIESPTPNPMPRGEGGPLATAKRIPHPACPHCFKLACDNCYGIYEEVPGTGVIINREIPDPAPGRPQGKEPYKHGQEIWYIGNQPYVGPTDEEPFSKDLTISRVEMKRIQARHMKEIMSIPGVHGFGMGAKGFIVFLLPENKDNDKQIPQTLEGIPVEVEIRAGGGVLL